MPSSMPMTPEDLDRLARRRANAKLGWYLHAMAFVLVNALVDFAYALIDPRLRTA